MRELAADVREHLDAAASRQREVEQQHVARMRGQRRQYFLGSAAFGDDHDVACWRQRLAQSTTHERVVVNDDDADHPATSATGMHAVTVVP